MTTGRGKLTERQAEVLAFVARHWGETGVFPTMRQIVAEFGFASPNAAVVHVRSLARKGWVAWAHVPNGTGTRSSRNVSIPELVEAAKRAAQAYLVRLTREE